MLVPFYFSDLPARAALFRGCTVLIDDHHFVCTALWKVYNRGLLDAGDYLAADKYIKDCVKDAVSIAARLNTNGIFVENWHAHSHEYRKQWCWAISKKLDGEPYETHFDTEKVYE